MIPKENDGKVHVRVLSKVFARMCAKIIAKTLAKAKSPFSGKDVVEMPDIQYSTFDTDEVAITALFKLKNGSWGAIAIRYCPMNDKILEAESFHCPARMKDILFSFYEKEERKSSL